MRVSTANWRRLGSEDGRLYAAGLRGRGVGLLGWVGGRVCVCVWGREVPGEGGCAVKGREVRWVSGAYAWKHAAFSFHAWKAGLTVRCSALPSHLPYLPTYLLLRNPIRLGGSYEVACPIHYPFSLPSGFGSCAREIRCGLIPRRIPPACPPARSLGIRTSLPRCKNSIHRKSTNAASHPR